MKAVGISLPPSRTVVLPEISFDEKDITENYPPTQPPAQLDQFVTPDTSALLRNYFTGTM